MTTEDFRMDLAQERDHEKRLVRLELEEMEREAERAAQYDKRVADAQVKVLEYVDHLMNIEGDGSTLYDRIWMDAMGNVRDAHRRLAALEREGL